MNRREAPGQVPIDLGSVTADELFNELVIRNTQFLQLLPKDDLIQELFRRDVGLIRTVWEQEFSRNRKTGGLQTSLALHGGSLFGEHSGGLLIHNPREGKVIDIKQYSANQVITIAYNQNLIDKLQYQWLNSHEVPTIPQHPRLAYLIACKLPNIYYVSGPEIPFQHYRKTQSDKLPKLYEEFRRDYASSLPKWDKEARQTLDKKRRNGSIEIPISLQLDKPLPQPEQNSEDIQQSDSDDFINDDPQEDEDEESVEADESQGEELWRSRITQQDGETVSRQKKRSRMQLDSESQSELVRNGQEPRKRLRRVQCDND